MMHLSNMLNRLPASVFLVISCVLCCGLYVGCKAKKVSTGAGGQAPGVELSERCRLKHDPGPCRGAFMRYYYDQKEGRCMSFIYGGCEGVVPFETLEDCQAVCGQQKK